MKRIVLFLATNMAIVLVLSFTMRLLGVEPYLNANGLNLGSLLVFAAVMGFGGALILRVFGQGHLPCRGLRLLPRLSLWRTQLGNNLIG